MTTHPETRSKFIRPALNYISRHNFDGLDLYLDSKSYNETDKEALVSLMKEFRTIFDYSNLLLTSTFGSYEGDNQFNTEDPHLLEMSRYLDLMHISNKSIITGLIKMSVPSTKITMQQQLECFIRPALYADGSSFMPYFYLCLMRRMQRIEEMLCDAEKCRVVIGGIDDKRRRDVLHFETSRHIANNMRFAMRHKLAGAFVFSPSNDDDEGCLIEQDTFMDF
ncbi:probable chitinase 2 [Sitodiplosis mosellana]|uniref:probable chitinase 2 n=1 Tax=Sitodiplosis mosellana TaxID=263140 RepID=UPI0024446F3B|nr:probable chitinase 2 [Sitodiplosis mosellana]